MRVFLTLVNGTSAAEISTGIICVCLPILAALSRPRRPRPSTSILNGKLYPRSPRCFGPDQPTSLNEKDLFNTEYLKVRENGSRGSGQAPQYAVVTAIRGGATPPRAVMESVRGGSGRRTVESTIAPVPAGEANNESAIAADGGGIVKSFRIEQSYV